MVVSVLTWPLIRKNLIAGQKSAFWMLVFVIGFVEVMAFIASSHIGHGTLAGECCSERFIPSGHRPVGLVPVQKAESHTQKIIIEKGEKMNTNKKTQESQGSCI